MYIRILAYIFYIHYVINEYGVNLEVQITIIGTVIKQFTIHDRETAAGQRSDNSSLMQNTLHYFRSNWKKLVSDKNPIQDGPSVPQYRLALKSTFTEKSDPFFTKTIYRAQYKHTHKK